MDILGEDFSCLIFYLHLPAQTAIMITSTLMEKASFFQSPESAPRAGRRAVGSERLRTPECAEEPVIDTKFRRPPPLPGKRGRDQRRSKVVPRSNSFVPAFSGGEVFLFGKLSLLKERNS